MKRGDIIRYVVMTIEEGFSIQLLCAKCNLRKHDNIE